MTKNNKRNGANGKALVPVATKQNNTTRNPRITPTAKGVIVKHKEFLTPLTTGSVAQYHYYVRANPGMDTFPWLSGVARNYETYTPKSVKFYFQSAVPSTQAGSYLMAFDYDASDPTTMAEGVTKSKLASFMGSKTSSLWQSQTLVLDGPALRTYQKRFVRDHNLVNEDIKLYDFGVFHMWFNGFAGFVGDLYVEYEFEFHVPALRPSIIDLTTARIESGPGASKSNIFGDNPVTEGSVISLENNVITFNRTGDYMVSTRASGTDPFVDIDTATDVTHSIIDWTAASANHFIRDWGVTVAKRGARLALSAAAATALSTLRINIAPTPAKYFV